eukprot:1172985-Rhodomonas_salina.1
MIRPWDSNPLFDQQQDALKTGSLPVQYHNSLLQDLHDAALDQLVEVFQLEAFKAAGHGSTTN